MSNEDILATIHELLNQEDIDQQVFARLVLAIVLDANHKAAEYQSHTNHNLDELKTLVAEQSESIRALTAVVQAHEQYIQSHPSLIYLLRYRTKETLATLIFILILLSAWYVSSFRQPLLKFLGLPVF